MASKNISKAFYKKISKVYDTLDRMYFSAGGRNPREVIGQMIPEDNAMILDMCCGTFANGLVVARNKPESTVIGLDRSMPMLKKARQKVIDNGLKNAKLICRDATDTRIKKGTFDYVIIGLVLHECNPNLWKGILSEAGRLLKDDGHLIILDWDIQETIKGKLKFSPLYVCENLVTPKYFKEYYYSDKRIFFNDYGFELEQMERCDVTFVASFKKACIGCELEEKSFESEDKYLKETQMVNFKTDSIERLVEKRGWKNLDEFERIGAIYDFVRNEIAFGYNRSDLLNAEEVLWDGYGQCNTKSTVLMALLRAVGIPCRLHGSEVSKDFQRGATSGIVSKLAPERVVHTWVEVLYKDKWIALEGVITDEAYVRGVKKKFPNHRGIFKGYAISVPSLETLDLEWKGEDLFVQNTSVVEDYGVFENPDDFFKEHKQKLSKLKELAYIYYGRIVMNKNVASVRRCSGVRPHCTEVCP
ncbi:Transglutaminase-like superfamily protein [Lachnospiraceae bacterium NE2001]|nr:Transglutaminase-like superfamily protein [Lachnospiraceae bacterium NE2001]